MSKKNSNVILRNYLEKTTELDKIYQNFKTKINKYQKKSFVVAVSGGPDSLALVALTKLYKAEKKTTFKYVLINHNIRKISTREAQITKNLLKKHDITLDIILNKKKIVKNIQGEARNIRYNLILNYCNKKKIKNLITAHNLEDQVETFFIRLSRGSGLTGLSSMNHITKLGKGIRLYRPLLDIKKKDLEKISKLVFKKYISDPSNENNKFLRARIRNLQIYLNKSGIKYDQIVRSINNLASSRVVLDDYVSKIFKNTTIKLKNEIIIDQKKFELLNNEIQIRIINKSIKDVTKNYYNPRSKKVIYLIDKLNSKAFKNSTLGGCIFEKKGYQISVKKEKK
tara:strand:- start:1032 stop:2051 length:1020 start_codon:yes stop_codon:yes gene_type:complete